MINIWQVGNTGVRNPMRIHDAFCLYAKSDLVGKIRGVKGAVAFTNYLCENGILNNEPGKDPTGSYGRKWRLEFNANGFTYREAKRGIGFSQTDIGPIDAITPFGRSFLAAETVPAVQEFFLRSLSMRMTQMGDGRTFSPLRWTLAVMLEVERLVGDSAISFTEFSAYVQTSTPMLNVGDVAAKIIAIREARRVAKSKKQFDKGLFTKLGNDYAHSSNNFREYGDMNLRYLKATGVLRSSGKGIAIVPEKHVLAEMLAEKPVGSEPVLSRYTELYRGPLLPTDNKDAALRMLDELKGRLRERGIAFSTDETDFSSAASINAARHKLETLLADDEEVAYAHQQKDKWEEISDYMTLLMSRGGRKQYDDDREIVVPKDETAAYLEWTVWRAFLAMNTLSNKPYEIRRFKIDQDFFPVGTAPGNGPDMIAEYDNCKVVVEVTMSDSSRQEAMEGEPVRRHVYDVLQGGEKPVYGLFVANKVNINTTETFRAGTWYSNRDERVRLNIVPLSLKQFQDYFVSLFRGSDHKNGEIVTFLDGCVKRRDDGDAPVWRSAIASDLESSIRNRANARLHLRIVDAVSQQLRFREYLPIFSLEAACGYFRSSEIVEPEGWVKAEGIGKLDDTMAVVRAVGDSMVPTIHDGDLCVVRKLGAVDYNNRIVLVQRNDRAADPETGGAYLLKQIVRNDDATILHSLNGKYSDVALAGDSDITVVAYLHKVLNG